MSRSSTLSVSDEIWRLIRETQKNLKEVSVNQKEARQEHKEARQAHKEARREMQEIRASHKEARREMQEIRASHKEAKQEMQEIRASHKEARREMQEIRASHKEARREMQEIRASQKVARQEIQEIRAIQKETSQQMKETDKKIHAVIGDFGNRWGKLGENLVKGSLVQRLKERGIEVERVITNAKNTETEFDIIAVNGKEVVVVEVKATLDPADVRKFTKNIQNFKVWWPEFKNKTIYGAMAFLIKANRQASSLAEKQGFFVIEATGDVIIQNEQDFKPKIFS